MNCGGVGTCDSFTGCSPTTIVARHRPTALPVVHTNDPRKASLRPPGTVGVPFARFSAVLSVFFSPFQPLQQAHNKAQKVANSRRFSLKRPLRSPIRVNSRLGPSLKHISPLPNTDAHSVSASIAPSHARSPVRVLGGSHPQGQGSPIWHPFSGGNRAAHFLAHFLPMIINRPPIHRKPIL